MGCHADEMQVVVFDLMISICVLFNSEFINSHQRYERITYAGGFNY
jgi:hypothetical protein